jgi:hypothetical protein
MKYRGIRGIRIQIIRDLKDINDEIMEERDPSILKSASQKSARQQRYYLIRLHLHTHSSNSPHGKEKQISTTQAASKRERTTEMTKREGR